MLSQPSADVETSGQSPDDAEVQADSSGSFTRNVMYTVGMGVGLALFVLLGATLFFYSSK